eukprot:jgi/Bigna1/141361/aug1.62_g16069
MTLFETAEGEGVQPQKWSEWIWDFVNDRIHTERLKLSFQSWISAVKKSDGFLDLSYGSITTSITTELCKVLIGHYKPKILSQLAGRDSLAVESVLSETGAGGGFRNRKLSIMDGIKLEPKSTEPVKKGGFFSSSSRKEEENLISLNLTCNYVGPEAVPSITDLITQVITIEELWLCGNPIGDQGVEHLCFGLQQAQDDTDAKVAPFLNRLYLQSCSITRKGFDTLRNFLGSYQYPLVVFIGGNEFRHSTSLPGLMPEKLREELLTVMIKYYDRILKFPKTSKWRLVSLKRACRYSDQKDQNQAQGWLAANLVANNFNKVEKSKKGDEFMLAEQKGSVWEGITWSLHFANAMKEVLPQVEVEARMFNLFQDLLIRVGTPYTGTIEKEHIFDELKTNPKLRTELKLKQVDFETFQERFSTVDKVKGGLMKVKSFIEYAAAFRHTLESFQNIFGKYQNEKGDVEKQALFKAMQKDPNVRKFFGLKKFHYKQFNEVFSSISFNQQSMNLNNVVDFAVKENNRRASVTHGRRRSVADALQAQIPPLQESRVVVRIALPDSSYVTMAAFSNWTIAELKPGMEKKMEGRGQATPKNYHLEIEGKTIEKEDQNLWTLAFTHLKAFPKMVTLTLAVSEFDEGWYYMTVRTNMRAGVSVQSDKIVTLEKEDLVHVKKVEMDPESKAIRGFVEPAKGWEVGERVLFNCEEIKKLISARVTSVSPLTVISIKTADSRSLPADWRGVVSADVDPSLLTKAQGWISLKSSAGQVCVQKKTTA